MLKAGDIRDCDLRMGKKIYYQSVGLDDSDAQQILRLSSTHSQIPEPLRVAHIIATAVVKGESYGRA